MTVSGPITMNDDIKDLLRRLADLVLELQAWFDRGGSRYWLHEWIKDVMYLVRRIDQEDHIQRLQDGEEDGQSVPGS